MPTGPEFLAIAQLPAKVNNALAVPLSAIRCFYIDNVLGA